MKKVVLKRKISTRVAYGHPWIYSNEIDLMDDELKAGEIAEVLGYDRKFIGKGYVNPVSRIPVRLLTRDKNEEINKDFFYRKILGA
jgi:23S rRNA (cytosine1962-C5)-methyltransferase